DKSKILGFITTAGTLNSHTSVLARTKGIPSIIGVGESLKVEYDGKSVIIDGFTGKIYIEPDYTTLTKFRKKRDSNLNYRKNLEKLKGKENVTQSGQRIAVLANVANREDIESVLRSDAGGIGLYRTEFLFMENDTLPTEDQQYLEYKLAAEAMGSKPVSIRTVDMGSDKTIREIDEGKVRNPALGYRGIRLLLNDEDVFYTQIRAILRASIYGNLSILLPMVTSSEEVSRAKEIIEKVKDDLRSSKILFDEDINLGVMIETPAAVMISGELARQVDYFSIGTNDLTALTLGVDRMNPKVEELFDVEHPAIMKMIRIITNNAHLEEKPVAICGDAAADLGLTEYFIKVGIDGLSVEPQKVLSLRKKVREIR
ncbi:MAG: phosphoenolpyruvate--protein phosphotransferase, partial [Lachnospiraceae bacterium]|nr:phosphoenolpyruvate--protein phosphotransferase [Lachnospiraceae bacterium]